MNKREYESFLKKKYKYLISIRRNGRTYGYVAIAAKNMQDADDIYWKIIRDEILDSDGGRVE